MTGVRYLTYDELQSLLFPKNNRISKRKFEAIDTDTSIKETPMLLYATIPYNDSLMKRLQYEFCMVPLTFDDMPEYIMKHIMYYVPHYYYPVLRMVNKFWDAIIMKYYSGNAKTLYEDTFFNAPNLVFWGLEKKYDYQKLFKVATQYFDMQNIFKFYAVMAKLQYVPNLR
jgi:hypothetical protein